MFSSFNCIPENLDHCVTEATLGGCFSAHTPTRNMWNGRSRWRRSVVSIFTDESKLGGGVFCNEFYLKFNFRLPDYCIAFPAEVVAIKLTVAPKCSFFQEGEHSLWQQSGNTSVELARCALKIQYLSTLNISSSYSLSVWMSGHNGISGNWKADEITKSDLLTPLSSGWERVGSPLASCVLALGLWTTLMFSRRCHSCMEEGEMETSRHILLHCPAFTRLRLKHLGSHIFVEGDNAKTGISRLNKFVIYSMRLVHLCWLYDQFYMIFTLLN